MVWMFYSERRKRMEPPKQKDGLMGEVFSERREHARRDIKLIEGVHRHLSAYMDDLRNGMPVCGTCLRGAIIALQSLEAGVQMRQQMQQRGAEYVEGEDEGQAREGE